MTKVMPFLLFRCIPQKSRQRFSPLPAYPIMKHLPAKAVRRFFYSPLSAASRTASSGSACSRAIRCRSSYSYLARVTP